MERNERKGNVRLEKINASRKPQLGEKKNKGKGRDDTGNGKTMIKEKR